MDNKCAKKHLTFEDRLIIEEGINKRLRKFEIAELVSKDPSCIRKEIQKHRRLRSRNSYNSPISVSTYQNVKYVVQSAKIILKKHVYNVIDL